jgi:hypothetical protein
LVLLLLLLLLLLAPAGLLAPSSGEMLLCGESILTEGGLDRATGLIGVCPQFDVLWGELTGVEHLLVAGHVKGLPWAEVCGQGVRLPLMLVMLYNSVQCGDAVTGCCTQ